MPSFNRNHTEQSDAGEWTPLPTGEYVMICADAKIAPSPFESTDRPGEHDDELTLRWELAPDALTPDLEALGIQAKQAVFERMRPWYGTGKRGDSKFKARIDSYAAQGLVGDDVWIAGPEDAGNQGDLVGIKQRVMVERYTKTMGANKGQPGNRVLAVAPMRNGSTPAASTPQPATAAQSRAVTAPAADIPPASYLDTLLDQAGDPSITNEEVVAIAQEMQQYAGPMFAKLNLATYDAVKLQPMLGRMKKAIDSMRSVTTEEELAF
jgi:hypothetical protein